MPWWLWWGMHQVILALIILQFQMSHLRELSSLESISIAPHSHYVVTTHEFWPISNTSQLDLAHSETWAKSSICGQQPQSPVVKVESLSGSQIVEIVPCTCSRYMTGLASDCPWVLHSCPQHHLVICTGNPRVFSSIPIPVPANYPHPFHGYG